MRSQSSAVGQPAWPRLTKAYLVQDLVAGEGSTTMGMRRFSLWIFLAAFVFRMMLAWRAGFFRHFEHDEMVRIAFSLVGHHGFGNPYLIPTGPTAHEMPVYPMFLAAIYSLFGITTLAEAVKITITCLVVALRCALLPLFAVDIGFTLNAARATGILGMIYVGALETELRGNWDGPWQALLLLILTWWTVRLWRTGWTRTSTPWLYFVLWAIAGLLQPMLLLVLAVFLGLGLFRTVNRRQFLKDSALLLGVIGLFFAPWIVRNYLRFGVLMPTRSNFGLEFWVSNGPGRAYDMPTNLGYLVPHPSLDRQEAETVARVGEVRYNRMKLAEALAWVRRTPWSFARLTAHRAWAWWFPPGRNVIHRLLKTGFSLFALAGLVLLFGVNRDAGVLIAATWLSFPLVYYVIQWSSKYRYPMEWGMVLCVALVPSAMATSVLEYKERHWQRS